MRRIETLLIILFIVGWILFGLGGQSGNRPGVSLGQIVYFFGFAILIPLAIGFPILLIPIGLLVWYKLK